MYEKIHENMVFIIDSLQFYLKEHLFINGDEVF